MPAVRTRTQELESRRIDLAIGYLESFRGSTHCQTLFEDWYVGIVRNGHPDIGERLSFEQFLCASHLIYQPAGGGHSLQDSFVDKAFWSAGVHRRVAVRLAHLVGISSIVSNTEHLAVIPRRLALACAERLAVRILELPIDIPRFNIAQYWHQRSHTDQGNRWLRGLFQRAVSPADPMSGVKPAC